MLLFQEQYGILSEHPPWPYTGVINTIVLKLHSDTLIVCEREKCHVNWNISDRLEGSGFLSSVSADLGRLAQRPI